MSEENLVKTFYRLKKEIAQEYKKYIQPSKVKPIKLEVLGFNKTKYSSYPYQRLRNIPAFYEHEKRAIIFNKNLLKFLNKQLILNILYHEFLHAISFRSISRKTGKTILRSGFYAQEFSAKRKRDIFKKLNEGIIQYFTNKKTGKIKNAGYQKEAKILTKIVKNLDEELLKKLFFKGKIEEFKKIVLKNSDGNLLKKLA